MITGIVAVAENFAVGKNGKLPWHYSPDLKFFKQTTAGHAIVMGRNTYESIGKPLPERLNIILSRSAKFERQPNLLVMQSREEILALEKFLTGDLFIIGGAKTYKTFQDAIEKWIVTEIPETVADADVFMPPDFLNNFRLREIRKLEANLRVKILERAITSP